MAMTGIHRSPYPGIEDHRDLWSRFAYQIVDLQQSEGCWEKMESRLADPRLVRLHPSSLWAWKPEDLRVYHETRDAHRKGKEKKPFDLAKIWSRNAWGMMSTAKRRSRGHHSGASHERISRTTVCTALAMLFLADGVRMPICGYVDTAGNTPSPSTLLRAQAVLYKQDKTLVTSIKLTSGNVDTDIACLPVVFFSGTTALSVPMVVTAMKKYLAGGGTAVVEVNSTTDLNSAQLRLKSMVTAGFVKDLPADIAFLKDFKGRRPKFKGMFNSKGRMVALFATIPPVKANPKIRQALLAAYSQAVYFLMKDRIDSEFFDPEYATLILGEDPFVARIEALAALKAEPDVPDRAKPVDVEPAGKKTDEAVKTTTKHDAPKPEPKAITPADEQW